MMRLPLLCLCFILFAGPACAVAQVQEVSPGVWLIEDHTLPIVTVKIAFENSGAAYDPKDKPGLSLFVSQMLDEGAGDKDSLAFHSALESAAIRFSAEAQEDTFTVGMQSLSEYKARALDLFTQALAQPRFDADAVERVRTGIVSELKELEEDPGYLASLNWKRAAFPGHPYATPRHGTFASLAAITREDLQAYAKLHFSCSPKRIAVVGDMTPKEVKQWLAGPYFKPSACNQIVPVIPDVTVADGGASPVVINVPVPQTVVDASLPGVTRGDPRYYAVVLLNHILGGDTLIARLGREIRDKRGLAYYAESSVAALDHAGYISVQFATRNSETQEAVDVFLGELKKMSAEGVTRDELADAKSYLTGSFPLQIDNEDTLADYLISMQHYHLGSDYLEKRNGLIEAVTLEQVNAAAKELLSHPPLIVMAGAPEDKSKP
jgi:zinc protease